MYQHQWPAAFLSECMLSAFQHQHIYRCMGACRSCCPVALITQHINQKDWDAGSGEHRLVDIWILLIMHSFGGSFSKSAGALMSKKVADASFSCDLLRQALVGHQARHALRVTHVSRNHSVCLRRTSKQVSTASACCRMLRHMMRRSVQRLFQTVWRRAYAHLCLRASRRCCTSCLRARWHAPRSC